MRRLVAVALLASIALVGVAIPAHARTSSLSDVDVTGAVGEKPTLEYSKPFATKKTAHREIVTGTGDKVVKGSKVSLHYLATDARTGVEIESSFGSAPVVLTIDPKRAVPGIVNSIIGATVGSRVLIGIAPKEGVAAGLDTPGVKKTDTLLFLADILETHIPLQRAEGSTVAPVDGLPKVKLAKNGTPTITVPKTTAPTTLVAQPLVVGDGPAVQAGQTITVHYRGVIWASAKTFDSSWKRAKPAQFVIGGAQVIAGLDEGLVGQTVGSQVLIVIPPDKGYGANGKPGGGIAGTDTLVFVVDILDAS